MKSPTAATTALLTGCALSCLLSIPLGRASQDGEQLAQQHNPLVQQAVADLALLLSVDPNSVELISFSEETWPDTSLGCPQPGMNYPQVPRDGARITLRSGDQVHHYHSGNGRPPFLCPQGTLKPATGKPAKTHENNTGVSQ